MVPAASAPLVQLPSLMTLPPFNTPAAAMMNPNMPGPGSIPPMGAKGGGGGPPSRDLSATTVVYLTKKDRQFKNL